MDAKAPAHPFLDAILDQAPRVMGLMDREALSPTVGCCDRTYWAWKFVDFPGARFQESLCVMGFLYGTEAAGEPYYGNPNLLRWIELGLDYWCSIQYRDGSFDEAYPYERSLAATAFTSFYVSEGIRFVGDALPQATKARATLALRKAGDWLVTHDEHHGFLSNHLAAAAAALMNIHLLTGDPKYKARCRYFVDKILAHQSSEGWYEEYGGADPGYQTHGSFYLARIWQLDPDDRLLDSIEQSMRFLSYFLHVDKSLGGEYASRNTQTYYPAAFEMLASERGVASWVADTMREAVGTASAAGLRSVDAYNYFPFLNNLVFAHVASEARTKMAEHDPPEQANGVVWFPKAGLARVRKEAYDAYIGARKGGVLKVFDRRRGALVYNDCGYLGRMKSKKLCSNQYEDLEREAEVDAHGLTVRGRFVQLSKPIMSPLKFMAFRAFNMTAGQVPQLAFWMKNVLVKALIYKKKELDLFFVRKVTLDETSIVVRDVLSGDASNLAELRWEPQFTTIHMGSSRYYVPNELEVARGPAARLQSTSVQLDRIADGLQIERRVSFDEDLA
ncbi:MAG: hypothetical protein RIT81_02045 [Deltaproteobacteria bacterium]